MDKSKGTVRIIRANTESAQFVWPYYLTHKDMLNVCDYLDELRTQAKWDAEQCANQQSKNI